MAYPTHPPQKSVNPACAKNSLDSVSELQSRTDQQWIDALRSNDGSIDQQRAFAELMNYQYAVVMNYLRRRQCQLSWLSTISHEELAPIAEDIVQTCLERLAKNECALLSQYEGRGAFTGWAAQIALNTARSELRRAHWHRTYPLDRELMTMGEYATEPVRVVERQESILMINQCLAQLSDIYREVVERCLINGERAGDVAKDLKRTVQAIYNILNRAKRKLIQLLKDRQIRLEDLGMG